MFIEPMAFLIHYLVADANPRETHQRPGQSAGGQIQIQNSTSRKLSISIVQSQAL